MRKAVIEQEAINPRSDGQEEWIDLEKYASVEVTSEDPQFPIESALTGNEGPGWRAAAANRSSV